MLVFFLSSLLYDLFSRSSWASRKPGSSSSFHQNSRREGTSWTTGYPRSQGVYRGPRCTRSSWRSRLVIVKLLLLTIPKNCQAQLIHIDIVSVQGSWDPLDKKECQGSVVDRESLDCVAKVDKLATLVYRAWKVRLILWYFGISLIKPGLKDLK